MWSIMLYCELKFLFLIVMFSPNCFFLNVESFVVATVSVEAAEIGGVRADSGGC